MVQMLLAEGMLLCSLFWAFCWLGTGSDEKNIRNFSTYPDEVQKIVKARPELFRKYSAARSCGHLRWKSAFVYCAPVCDGASHPAGIFCRQLFEHSAFRTGAESVLIFW